MTLGKFAIYTAVFGGYDYVPLPRGVTQGDPDFLCFTDQPANVPRGWQVVEMRPPLSDPGMANRHVKLYPHVYLESYDTSLYIDANVALKADPRALVKRYLDGAGMAIPRHPERDCVYDEALACIEAGKAPADEVKSLMETYRDMGMPRHGGLSENFLIARRHHDPSVIALTEMLWDALEAGPRRDQLHLPFLVWKQQVSLRIMDESSRELGWLLRRIPHQVRPGSLRDSYYRLLARHYPNALGRLLEAGLSAYTSLKEVRRGRRA